MAGLAHVPSRDSDGSSVWKGDRAQLASVIGLTLVGCPAVTEESVRIGIGIEVKRLDLADAGREQAMNDVARQIEMRSFAWPIGEEAAIGWVVVEEARTKAVVHFVRTRADARADRGADAVAAGAEALHRRQGRIGYPGQRPSPASVGSADDTRRRVGEQDGRAIGGENREQQAGAVADHRIRMRTLILWPGPLSHDRFSRMNLVNGDKLRAGQERLFRAPAILVDGGAVVVAAVAHIQPGQFARRHAATPPKEAMRQSRQAPRADDFDGAHSASRMMMSSSA